MKSDNEKKIVLLKKCEVEILDELFQIIDDSDNEQLLESVTKNRAGLENLAKAISFYPTITGITKLGTSVRNIESLITQLCNKDENDFKFNIPTKAILGKSYLIAKFNFFYSFKRLMKDIPKLKEKEKQIDRITFDIIFTIMVEEVFISITMDDNCETISKKKISYLLVDLWEYRLDHGMKLIDEILFKLWDARDTLIPVFGTLRGTTEMFQLFMKIDPRIADYIKTEQETFALKEFIFGLSFEELEKINKHMEFSGQTVMSEMDILKFLDKDLIKLSSKNHGPKEFYSFFLQRKNNARHRKYSSLNGPKRTLEEIIIKKLIDTQ